MADGRVRELERRWRESGSLEDESAWLLERSRVGDRSLSDEFFFERIRRDSAGGRKLYETWLSARGAMARAAYLTAERALAEDPSSALARSLFLARRGAVDRPWLARMEEPSLLRSAPLPGPRSWWSIGLGEARPAGGTYGRYDYRELPDLDPAAFLDFAWLEGGAGAGQGSGFPDELLSTLDSWRAQLAEEGFPQPDRLFRLLGELAPRMAVINSCTDCYFMFRSPPRLVDDAAILPFYSDSQGCVLWALWLHREGGEAVVTFDLDRGQEPPAVGALEFCAPSLEAFVYRFWLENEIWFAENLGDEVRASRELRERYLNFYRAE